MSLPVLKSAQEPDVLTRRQQLGLAAQAKENSKDGKGRGRGRGGKGRGKVGARPADATTIKRAVENQDGEASTPRRKLFEDEPGDVEPSQASAMTSGMDVDPPAAKPSENKPKRVRGKRTPAPPKAEEAPMNSSPPIKQKKKRAKGPKDAKEQEHVPENVPPQHPSPSQPDVPEPAEAPAEKIAKQPGKAKIKSSENALNDAQKDPASWHHVLKLWGALDTLKVSKGELGSVPKFQYWSFSFYWKTNRVGLLTKSVGGKYVHRASFGGSTCCSMAMPLKAALLFVVALVIQDLMIQNKNLHFQYLFDHI